MAGQPVDRRDRRLHGLFAGLGAEQPLMGRVEQFVDVSQPGRPPPVRTTRSR